MLRAWLQASRPLSQANIAVPLVFGQALAYALTGRFDAWMCVLIHVFGLVDQLFIVWANDYADFEADAKNEAPTLFSGGSRVLVEGKLSRAALGRAAVVAGALVVAIGGCLAVGAGRWHALALALAAIALLVGYSFKPLRMSYRGDGEVLQGLGIGVVLPLFAYGAQVASLAEFPWPVLVATFLLGYAGNVTTALPDTPADAATDKRTLPVRIGQLPARVLSVLLLAVAACAPLVVGPTLSPLSRALVVAVPLAVLVPNLFFVRHADAGRDACVLFVLVNGSALNALLVAWSVALVLEAGALG